MLDAVSGTEPEELTIGKYADGYFDGMRRWFASMATPVRRVTHETKR
jgi:hypothetical protein